MRAWPQRCARSRPRLVDQYVELGREQTDKIFVLLTEFGNERQPAVPRPGHGPADRRARRRSTVRAQPDPGARPGERQQHASGRRTTRPAYFKKLYFGEGAGVESLKTYYEKQSSNRYSVDGTVTGWVQVRYNEARYGRSTDDPDRRER